MRRRHDCPGVDCRVCELEAERRMEPPPPDDWAADAEAANEFFDRERGRP